MGVQTAATAKKDRILWMDIAKGLAMFLVCWGHENVDPTFNNWIYSFHMPLFFMLSGMTFAFNKETHIGRYIGKKAKGLLIPYVFLNIIVMPLSYIDGAIIQRPVQSIGEFLLGIFFSQQSSGYVMPSNTTWFIATLFLTDIAFFLFWKIFKKDRFIIIAIPAASVVCYLSGLMNPPGGSYWHVKTVATSAIFYLAGYLFLKHIAKIKEFLKRKWLHILLICALFVAGAYFETHNDRVSMIANSYAFMPYFYIAAFSSSIAFILLMMLLSESGRAVKLLKFADIIGKNTLPYIAFQVPVMRIMKHCIPFFNDGGEGARILMCVIFYFAFIPASVLIQKIIPGRKKKIKTA